MNPPDFAGLLEDMRRAYQPRPIEWVLNPWEYDFVAAHMETCEDPHHKAFFAQCVRAEPMP